MIWRCQEPPPGTESLQQQTNRIRRNNSTCRHHEDRRAGDRCVHAPVPARPSLISLQGYKSYATRTVIRDWYVKSICHAKPASAHSKQGQQLQRHHGIEWLRKVQYSRCNMLRAWSHQPELRASIEPPGAWPAHVSSLDWSADDGF